MLTRVIFWIPLLCVASAGCSDQASKSLAGSIASGAAQTAINAVASVDVQALPGHFSVSVDGRLDGDHWDPQGRRFTPRLSLVCSGRDSVAHLLFRAPPVGSSAPLPTRGTLQASIVLADGRPRTFPLERLAGHYVLQGGLPLVHELINAPHVQILTVSADGKPMPMQFDTRDIKRSIRGRDFYCSNAWLADAPPRAVVLDTQAALPSAPRLAPAQQLNLDTLRGEMRALPGVTSTASLDDGTMILGMNGATAKQVSDTANRSCELMRTYPMASGILEVHGSEGMHGKPVRISCPR